MKYYKSLLLTAMGMLCVVFMAHKGALVVNAKAEPVVAKGVFVEGMDLSGMTKTQARTAIENYVYKLLEDNTLLHLQFEDVAEHQPSGAVLGGQWTNTELVDELITLGNQGHVVDRYKSRKALEREPVNYDVEIGFSKEPVVSYIEKTFTPYNHHSRNPYALTPAIGLIRCAPRDLWR